MNWAFVFLIVLIGMEILIQPIGVGKPRDPKSGSLTAGNIAEWILILALIVWAVNW